MNQQLASDLFQKKFVNLLHEKIHVFKPYITKMLLKWMKYEIFTAFIIHKKTDHHREKIKNQILKNQAHKH